MDNVISLDKVTKKYGTSRGVTEISLDVEKGAVFGFLGPNGAGKSTTINMLVDLIRPTGGKVTIFGLDSINDSLAIRQRIGFLTGDMALDERLTGLKQLTYFGNLRGGVPLKRIVDLAKTLDLNLNRKIKNLSRGNRQKVGLISALMHDPELLIFDEPTTGLDPLIQAQFNKIILQHKAAGKTAFISSHLLSEVQEICDEVVFIREGKLVNIQKMKNLVESLPRQIQIFSKDKNLESSIKSLPGAVLKHATGTHYTFTYQGDMNALIKLLAKHNVINFEVKETDLETIFMSYYGGQNAE